MPNGLKQLAENLLELKEAISEEELLAGSLHPRAEHVILLLRNLAVGAAAALFLVSLFHLPCRYRSRPSPISSARRRISAKFCC